MDFPDNVESVQIGHEEPIGVAIKDANFKGSKDKKPALFGFIDRNGRFLIKPQFCAVGAFKNGVAVVHIADALGGSRAGVIDKSGKWILQPIYDSVISGMNLFSVTIPDSRFFSRDEWKDNRNRGYGVQKLFRDKKIIGMPKYELQWLLGQPISFGSDYCSYGIGSGIDTTLLIDFAFDRDSKICKWRKRMISASERENENFPTWTTSDKYE
jgi:hypothetical protein